MGALPVLSWGFEHAADRIAMGDLHRRRYRARVRFFLGAGMNDLIETARDLYACDDIAIDDGAAISETESGTWVAAWVWVAKADGGEE